MLFSKFLARHARGEVDRLMEAELKEVAEAVLLHNKKGSVTLVLSMEKNGARIMLATEVKSRKPTPSLESGTYFFGPDGLQREDPVQAEFATMQGLGPDGAQRVVDDEGVVTYDPDEGVEAPTGDED